MDKRPTICVDLDGVLARQEEWLGIHHFGDAIPGARKFLLNLRERGFRVVIYTCRCCRNLNFSEDLDIIGLHTLVKNWLRANEMPYDQIYVGQGKPVAMFYVDDRAIEVPENPSKEELDGVLRKILERSS